MKVAFLAVLIASFTSVSLAGLAGIAPNAAATTATGGRESIFDLVTINPTSGQASATQKRIFAPAFGTLDLSNVLFSENGQWVLSLQNYDQSSLNFTYMGTNPVNPANNPQYLARQDLAEGGVYEFCSITGVYSPINIFWDTDRSVIATAVGNGIFALVRYSFDDTRATCTSSIITPLAGFNSIVANLRASRASDSARIIYFVTEPAGGFSSSTNTAPQIRSFSVSGTNAVPLFTVTLNNGLFPVTLATLSDEVVAFQAWTATLSGSTAGFGTYEVNLRTFLPTTVLAARAVASTGAGITEELSFSQTFVNQTNTFVTLKGVQATATTPTQVTNFHIATTSFATAGAAESRVSSALNTQSVFYLFDLANATISNIAVDNTQGGNFAVITGTATFAGTQSITSVSRCRFTQSGSSLFANAIGAGDRVSCLPPTTPTSIGTQVDFEFAADGVNYNARTSYSHNGVAAGARFARTTYTLRDGTAIEAGAAPVTVELLDAAGRRILFANSVTVTLNVASTGGAAIRGVVGNSATSTTSGIATFPSLSIDVDAADADGIARVTLSATFSGATSSTTATANVRLINRTRGTLAGLAFPSVASGTQTFETQLIDPRNNANTQRIAARSQIDTSSTGGIALGLVAYDNENKILNTVEISSTNGLVLSGSALGGSFTRGAGACTIPSSANNANDGPTSIWYEKTNLNTDGTVASVDFLAIVNTVDSATTAQGRRIVRITRLQGSLQATACRLAEVDRIPIFDDAYGNHITIPLSSGRNVNAVDRIAFVEPDYYFPASGASVLNVWRISVTGTPGAWVIRNKVLRGFQVNAVTQSATNELAFSGQSVPVSVPVKIGIYLVDISTQTSPIVPANTQTVFPQQATEFAAAATNSDTSLFLVAGSADSLGASRYRFTGASTAAGAQQLLTNHLARATETLTPDVARAVELSTNSTVNARNYVDFFNIDDPVITAVSPSQVAITATTTPITVTANNVIVSGQLRCRFTTQGVTSVEVTTNAAATLEVAADGRTVNCGNLPSTFAGQNRFVYLQLSNDGGLTYGPEAILLVGSPVRPTNFGPTPVGPGVPNAPATRTFSVVLETNHAFAPTAAQVAGIETVVNSILAAFDGVTRSIISTSQTAGASTTTYSFTLTSTTADRIQRAALGLNANLANLLAAFSLTGANGPALIAAGVTRASVVEGISATASTNDSGLSDGAIAGIVIGSVIGGLLLIGGAIFALTRAGASKTTGSSYNARDVSRIDGSSSGSSYDSDYSDYDYSEETDGDYDESDDEDYSDYV